MAISIILRSQCRAKVSALLSNVSRFSTCSSNRTTTNFKLFEHKNVTSIPVATKYNLTPMVQNMNVRNISLSTANQSAAGGDHSFLWTAERAVSAGLLLIVPAALAFPSQTLDTLLAISVVMHAHWGLDSIATDYTRLVLGEQIAKVVPIIVILYSAILLGGLLYFIYTDVGISRAIRSLWAVKGK